MHEQSFSATNLENIVIENLIVDTEYSFTLLIANTVGVVSSKSRQFCELTSVFLASKLLTIVPTHVDTTDVQMVTAAAIENMNSFQVYCEFITGTDARGCVVVLVGELDNLTSCLDRNNSKFLTSTIPLSCYHEIFAYDIENDGMNGTLAIPGVLVKNFSFPTPCQETGELGGFLSYNFFLFIFKSQ